MENGVGYIDRGLTENETRTADGGVSELKLAEHVVHAFHESKDSEGDEVFEEAMMDASPEVINPYEHRQNPNEEKAIVNGDQKGEKLGGFDSLEANGNNGEVHNVEGDVKEISTTVDGETNPLTTDEEGFNGSSDVIVLAKSENGDKVKLVEESVIHVESPDVEKVSSDEVGLSHGDECSEQIPCQDERSREMKDTSLDEGVGTSEIKNPPFEFSSAEIDERVRSDAVELEAIDGQNSQVQRTDENVDGVKNLGRPLLEEETITADRGVSQFKLAENVVHESKESEGVEVFKEAMIKGNPEDVHPQTPDAEEAIFNGDQNVEKMGDFDSLRVNGSPNNVHEAEKFNEAFEIDQPIVVEENREAVVAAESFDDIRVAEAVIKENKEAVVVDDDDDDNVKEVLLKDLNNGVVSNEGYVKEIFTVNVDEEIKGLTDDEGSSSSCDVIVRVKSESGEKVKSEEKPVGFGKSLDVCNEDSDGIGLSHGNESIVNVDSSVDGTPEIKTFTTNPGASEIDDRVRADSTELESKDGRDSRIQQTDEDIKEGLDDHPVVEESEEQETPYVQEKQGSVSKQEPSASNLAREPEIRPTVDPNQCPPARPAGLGGAAPLLEPTPRALQQPRVNGAIPQRQAQIVEDSINGESEENDETREKLQMIRVKFLRLAHRLGQTPHNVVVAQVLYRLGLAEQLRGRNTGRVGAFSFDRASAMAEQLEAAGQEPLDFSCTIMVIGKTGVGKSATINSIFDEVKFSTDAFQMGTKKVQDVVGTVQGIKVRVIDTPGLLPCWSDQCRNEKILHSIKRFIKTNPPDIVLYLDRLDMQSRDFGDMPLLRTITEIFGPSIWFNAIVVLTHAASAPPDGPNGVASSYEMFVTQRSHVVQQAIRQAAGDMRLMNPVSLVENHSACRTNRAGQRVLPNGQVWKPHLLLLSFASKILAEANTLLKLQDSPPGKPFATRPRVPPLPLLLSSLLQSRPQLKMPEEQFGDDDDLDEDLYESSDSDDDSDYDELPPFKRLMKAQLAMLNKAQKKAYFDELEYREKLFMKKQLKEEKKRRKLLKKMADSAKDLPNDYNESVEEESGGAASVPVPMPDFSLPISFDSDNPTHRYRFLDSSSQWLVRPVLETHGWDHDVGYEGINVERLFVIKDKIPASFSGQVTKDKKEANLQMELASSIKHGEGKATSVGFDMQSVGKDMAYTLRGETRFSNFRHNKTAAGLSFTLLGDALTAGVKLEDRLIVNKRFQVVLTGGAMTSRGDAAYGGSLEATLRDKDYPLGRTLSTLGLSIMDWHGDLAIGCNLQSQIPLGRTTNLIARANLNNRGAGQVSIRLNSSEQLQIALIGLLPLFKKMLGHYQEMLYGE